MSDQDRALKVTVTGRVQGVGYRDWTKRQAMQLGLSGHVRNLPDGGVEALIIGPDVAVSAMLEQFWTGPRFASVSGVVAEPSTSPNGPAGFQVLR